MRREVNWHVENVWPLVIIIVVLGVVVCPSGFPFCDSIWRAARVRHGHSIRATRPLYCRKKEGLFSSHLSLFIDNFRLLTTLMFPLKKRSHSRSRQSLTVSSMPRWHCELKVMYVLIFRCKIQFSRSWFLREASLGKRMLFIPTCKRYSTGAERLSFKRRKSK